MCILFLEEAIDTGVVVPVPAKGSYTVSSEIEYTLIKFNACLKPKRRSAASRIPAACL
jgi:hypothetical protein